MSRVKLNTRRVIGPYLSTQTDGLVYLFKLFIESTWLKLMRADVSIVCVTSGDA